MARLICDRCGCEIEGIYHVRYIRTGRLNGDESRYYTYCRDCASSIERWLNNMREQAIGHRKH